MTLEEGTLTLRTRTPPRLNIYGGMIRAGAPLDVRSDAIFAYGNFEIGGNADLTLYRLSLQQTVVVTVNNTGQTTTSITGGNWLTKMGPGVLNVNGGFLTQWTVGEGVMALDGFLDTLFIYPRNVAVALGAELRGSGQIPGPVKGQGLISPGASEGILAVETVSPADGLDIALEFTSTGAPAYGNRNASVNDLLATTASAPFSSPLGAQNHVDIFFDVAALTAGDVFKGGFFAAGTDPSVLLSDVAGADFAFWIANPAGAKLFNGQTYLSLEPSLVRLGTVAETANIQLLFAAPANGSITTFTIIPEPATALAILCAGALFAPRRPSRSQRQ